MNQQTLAPDDRTNPRWRRSNPEYFPFISVEWTHVFVLTVCPIFEDEEGFEERSNFFKILA